jgi:hypothetical protein
LKSHISIIVTSRIIPYDLFLYEATDLLLGLDILLTVRTPIKNRLNYQGIVYDPTTNEYKSGEGQVFLTREDAKSSRWKCNKCHEAFSSYKQVRVHKSEFHSY